MKIGFPIALFFILVAIPLAWCNESKAIMSSNYGCDVLNRSSSKLHSTFLKSRNKIKRVNIKKYLKQIDHLF